MKATLVGDIHGKTHLINWQSTLPIIQVGDFGFFDSYELIKSVPPTDLMIVGGNHDEYPVLKTLPQYLGDFGIIPGTERTFFCRGAYSIDKHYRTEGISWWADEELTYDEVDKMLDLYEEIKPEVMITHDCPNLVKSIMFDANPIANRTGQFLDEAFRIHRPKTWYFGHWHQNITLLWHGTEFVCLAEGKHLEVELP
jgi:hypothetical protein